MLPYHNEHEANRIISEAPAGCGVYLIRDKEGHLLYVGKSISIRKRLAGHLKAAAQGVEKEDLIMGGMNAAEFIMTENELEALILENNIIKRHQPRYNILMRDDKNYPYLRIDPKEEFPRITVVRRDRPDGAIYFGPYIPAKAMRKTLRYLGSLFPLRKCEDVKFSRRTRPCLNFEIGRCLAPCSGKTSREEYREMVQEIILFLKGRRGSLRKRMERKMAEESELTHYEEAARLRDRLSEMDRLFEKQSIFGRTVSSADILGLAEGTGIWVVYVMFVRQSNVIGGEPHNMRARFSASEKEVLQAFIERFYSSREDIPAGLVLPRDVSDKKLLEKYLSSRRGKKVGICVPSRGRGLELLLMARKNALAALSEKNNKLPMPEAGQWSKAGITFDGEGHPKRIETYDASSTRGKEAVVGMVLWENGNFSRKDYRRFRIRISSSMDDYAMIREAVGRRCRRINKGEVLPPELIVVDGGPGHVSSVKRELDMNGLDDVPVLGISKGEKRRMGDRIHLDNGRSPDMPQTSPLVRFVGSLRNEAHRYAVGYHRYRRGALLRRSALDDIRGIGKRRKAILMNYFGDLRAVQSASLDELQTVPGLPSDVSERLYRRFHPTG